MDKDNLQRNYEGYLATPLLWINTPLYGLEPYDLKGSTSQSFKEPSCGNLRLGKMVERFVSHQLAADPSCCILAENIQVQDGKRTIGELDALINTETGPIHLEIIYKFYLYDPAQDTDELSHWIGPNRNDSLLEKLGKLKAKQLPLLYHPKTQPLLESLGLNLTKIKQKVLFKAQLFLPLYFKKELFYQLNSACVSGFYAKVKDLQRFEHLQFHIPKKRDWIMEGHIEVEWMDYTHFMAEVYSWLAEKRSPLCWLRDTDKIEKFFVVWW